MRAAVIGTGWGRVHIAALQRIGVEVVAVCGTDLARTEQVARDCEGALAITDLDGLGDLGLDLITIAAPTSAHADLVARLGPTPLLCEKPAVGVDTLIAELPLPSGPVWVNYAFPFLDVAAQAERVLASLVESGGQGAWQAVSLTAGTGKVALGVDRAAGSSAGAARPAEVAPAAIQASAAAVDVAPAAVDVVPAAIQASAAAVDVVPAAVDVVPAAVDVVPATVDVEVVSWYDLGGLVAADRSAWQWLSDVASHPWSWVIARFGAPAGEVRGWLTDSGGARLAYRSESGVAVSVAAIPAPGFSGLRHEVTVRRAGHTVRFGGAFHLGGEWSFGPVHLDGEAVVAEERETETRDADPWFMANVAAIGAVVRAVGGDTSGPAPFTWDQALTIDACVQEAEGLRS